MPRTLINDETGERVVQLDSGELIPAERAGLLVQAGRQLAELGGGAKELYGQLTGDDALVAQAQAEAAERNEIFRGTDIADPITSFAGQAIPGLLTAPITGGSSLVGQVAANVAIGALESGLDIGQGGTTAERATVGAVGGAVGDVAGRMLGRVWNAARGLTKDVRLGREIADNPKAVRAEELGLELLGSERAVPDSPQQRILQRLEQGAESSMFSPGMQASKQANNQVVHRDAVLRAIGLEGGAFDEIGTEALSEANRIISDQFSNIAAQATSRAPLDIGEEMAERIANTQGQIPKLMKRGRFRGLADGKLSGEEWTVARRALSQDASNAAAKGDYELADDIFADVEQLDRLMEPNLTPDALEEFARAREQYRVLRIISKQGVIDNANQVNHKNLNRALQAGTGFGDTAKQGRATVNPESSELIELAKVASDPNFQPFRSSGTAENLSAQRMAGMALDPTQWLSLVGEAAAPALTGATSSGGGRAVTGALTPAPVQAVVGGGAAGRSMLDEALYPFVGIKDERRP